MSKSHKPFVKWKSDAIPNAEPAPAVKAHRPPAAAVEDLPDCRRTQISDEDVRAIGAHIGRTGRNARSAMGGMLEQGALYDMDHGNPDPQTNPYGALAVAEYRAHKEGLRVARAAHTATREPSEDPDPFAITARPTLGRQMSVRDVDEYLDEKGISRRLKEVLRVDPTSHRLLELYCGDEGSTCEDAPLGRITAILPATRAGSALLRREIRKQPHLQLGPVLRLLEVVRQKRKDPITVQDLTDAVSEARAIFRVACARWNDTDREEK